MGALSGIRVIDVGLLVQGPQAGQTLVDLGAEVIKVELPLMGDMARWIPISMEDLRTPYFEACNRGKRSITVDLRVPEGAKIFRDLVDSADVLLANFKPGTLESWGIFGKDFRCYIPVKPSIFPGSLKSFLQPS